MNTLVKFDENCFVFNYSNQEAKMDEHDLPVWIPLVSEELEKEIEKDPSLTLYILA